MKIALYLVVLAAVVLCALAAKGGKNYDLKKPDGDLFKEWVADHPGRYGRKPSREQVAEKYKNFKAFAKKARELNEASHGEAQYGLTEFADLSEDEFRARYANLKVPEESLKRMALKSFSEEEIASVPASKDWRSHSAFKVVAAVQNQGSCGSCWAFSTVANIEGAWAVKWQKATWKMSEKQVLDCTLNGSGGKYGCNGGWMGAAVDQLATSKSGGLRSTSSYGAYAPSVGTCKTVTTGAVAKLTGHVRFEKTEAALKAALIKYGPIMIIIDAGTWGSYRGGIMGSTCVAKNYNHAVTLVGYGSSNGTPIWIVKNSWGTGWGINGYAYIRRGSTNYCGVLEWGMSAVIAEPPPAKWVNYGGGYAGMSRSGSAVIFNAGLVTTGTTGGVTSKWSTNPVIRRLSIGVAPAQKRIFVTPAHNNIFARVDVANAANTSTTLTWTRGGSGIGWVSLDSIVYARSGLTPATLVNNWTNYGNSFEAVSFALQANGTYLAGLARHTLYPKGKPLFVLPPNARPAQREIFPSLANDAQARIDVFPTGEVSLMATTPTSGWLSLSNVHFRPAVVPFTKLTPANYWVHYTGFAAPGASLSGDARVFLRGMIKSGRAVNLLTLGTAFRPTARRMFSVACSTGICRVDVQTTGVVTLVGKTYGTTSGAAAWPSWISLSGIAYDLTPDTTAA